MKISFAVKRWQRQRWQEPATTRKVESNDATFFPFFLFYFSFMRIYMLVVYLCFELSLTPLVRLLLLLLFKHRIKLRYRGLHQAGNITDVVCGNSEHVKSWNVIIMRFQKAFRFHFHHLEPNITIFVVAAVVVKSQLTLQHAYQMVEDGRLSQTRYFFFLFQVVLHSNRNQSRGSFRWSSYR